MILIHPADPSTWAYLLLKHRKGGHWAFSKGHVEPGESDWQAALRELEEETGLGHPNRVAGFERKVFYQVRHQDVWRNKSVVYFMATTAQTQVEVSTEHTAFDWLSYSDARRRLTHDNDRKLLDQSETYFSQDRE